ncbi:MAG TPA: hypothetical protein VGL40_15485 [Bacillota bacterium]
MNNVQRQSFVRRRVVRCLTAAATVVGLLLLAGLSATPALALPAGVLGVETEHLVMRVDDQGMIITYAARVTNGTATKADRLTFSLPDGYTGLTFVQGLTETQVDKGKDGFVARDGLAAGAGLDVAFSYHLPISGHQGTVARKVNYQTGNLSIVVQVDQMAINGEGLTAGDTVSLNGATFKEYHRGNIPAGTTVQVGWTLGPGGSATTGTGATGATGTDGSSATASPAPGNLLGRLTGGPLPVALFLLGLVVVGYGAYAYTRGRSGRSAAVARTAGGAAQPAEAAGLAGRKAELVHHIASLDRRHQSGELADEAYQTERSRAKDELVQVMLTLRGSSQE